MTRSNVMACSAWMLMACSQPYGPADRWPDRFFEGSPGTAIDCEDAIRLEGPIIEAALFDPGTLVLWVEDDQWSLQIESWAVDGAATDSYTHPFSASDATWSCTTCLYAMERESGVIFAAVGGEAALTFSERAVGETFSVQVSDLRLVETILDGEDTRPVEGGRAACLEADDWGAVLQPGE